MQTSGVVTVQAENGATIEVTFENDSNTVIKLIESKDNDGTVQAVVLTEQEVLIWAME